MWFRWCLFKLAFREASAWGHVLFWWVISAAIRPPKRVEKLTNHSDEDFTVFELLTPGGSLPAGWEKYHDGRKEASARNGEIYDTLDFLHLNRSLKHPKQVPADIPEIYELSDVRNPIQLTPLKSTQVGNTLKK